MDCLRRIIQQATEEIGAEWCVSVFTDNAGIIEFDDNYNIVFKVETHNHPSAIEPYGGAGTGIGGVIRDSLGTGLGAKPILNTDVFCFGLPDLSYDELPKGALHPKADFQGRCLQGCETTAIVWGFQRRTVQFCLTRAIRGIRSSIVAMSV